ncbi:MAG: aminotransferase class I/II-fold pyridoxal phosphate-dependent enzyme [Lachnospiraceae bacterium]|nr:aminotransferase class I/II-fold pyridoxal phosphate-dependent enzyme [Lachnospiraceae bacterium]
MVLPFEKEYRERYYKLLEEVFESNFWSDGKMTATFEEKFGEYTGLHACAVSSGGTGLLSILEYVDVRGKEVVVPANTFWATAQAVKKAGGTVVYADCNREDLCLSYDDMVSKITSDTKAVMVVHIGGHIAFEIEKIAKYCEEHKIALIEDCAHAHGARWNGKTAGSWGMAGSYSFYATKTMPLGEGGMVVSRDRELIGWMKKFRNYGKEVLPGNVVTYPMKEGFNYRISEFMAALGIVQMERLPVVLDWKRELAHKFDSIFYNRVVLPEGMQSGYYKYIVFDETLSEETGKVFNYTDFGNEIEGITMNLPNSYWVAEHHRCVPIYYGWDKAGLSAEKIGQYLKGRKI